MMNPSSSQHKQDRISSFEISEPLFTVHEQNQIEEKADIKLLDESQKSIETLQKAYDKLDIRFRCYTFWLIFMAIVSGFSFVYGIVKTFNAFRHHNSLDKWNLLVFAAFTGIASAQYIFEIWAIYARDLAKATSALKIVKLNTYTFLALNVFIGYNLYKQDINSLPSESTAIRKAFLTFCLIVTLILSVTQIFITHLQAIKVRDNLAKREDIRAQLRSR